MAGVLSPNKFDGVYDEISILKNDYEGIQSSGQGCNDHPAILGSRPCVSVTGCRLGDGRKYIPVEGVCGLCGGSVK